MPEHISPLCQVRSFYTEELAQFFSSTSSLFTQQQWFREEANREMWKSLSSYVENLNNRNWHVFMFNTSHLTPHTHVYGILWFFYSHSRLHIISSHGETWKKLKKCESQVENFSTVDKFLLSQCCELKKLVLNFHMYLSLSRRETVMRRLWRAAERWEKISTNNFKWWNARKLFQLNDDDAEKLFYGSPSQIRRGFFDSKYSLCWDLISSLSRISNRRH